MQTRLTSCWKPRRRARVDRALLGAFVISLAFSPVVRAQSVRVAVIHAAQQSEAARRLRAEVLAAGLEAVDISLSAADHRSTASIACANHAVSGLRMRQAGELELVVIECDTGNVLESVLFPAQESEAELDVRAVEDLRAKLVEFAIMPPVADDAASAADASPAGRGKELTQSEAPKASPSQLPTTVAARPAPQRVPSLLNRQRAPLEIWLQVAAGSALGSGGLGGDAVSSLGARLEPSEHWSVTGLAILPLSAQKVANSQGSATVDAHVFGAMLGLTPTRLQTLEFDFGLGGGAVLTEMRGVATAAGEEGRSRSVWAGVGLVQISVAWRVSRWLRLRAATMAGEAGPRPTVLFDGEAVAAWGRPFALATLGVELAPLRSTWGSP